MRRDGSIYAWLTSKRAREFGLAQAISIFVFLSCSSGASKTLLLPEAVLLLATEVSGNLQTEVLPVVFLHAFPLSGVMWRSQFPAVGRPAVIIDFRGYGKSVSEGTEEFSIPLFARDVLETVDALAIKKAIFAGCSMGGYTIFELWRQAPERFAAMILVDTKAEADTDEGRQKRFEQIEKIRSEGGAFIPQFIVDALMSPSAPERQPQLVEEVKTWVAQVPDRVVMRTLQALAARADSGPNLPQISVPALVIVGDEDKATPVENAQRMATEIPHAKLKIVPGAGHLTPLEAPTIVTDEIAAFLRSI
jgi:3-oxoadipate enol-lactonase